MSAMFLAMVWHARRHRAAARCPRAAHGRTRLDARATGALPPRRLPRAEDADHDRARPSGDSATLRRRHLATGGLGGDRRALAHGADRGAAVASRARRRCRLRHDRRGRRARRAARGHRRCAGPRSRRGSGGSGSLAHGTMRADPDALRIALDALVENAVATPTPTDAIEIRASRAAGRSRSTVADEGSGIPPRRSSKIFERFARADPAGTARRRAGRPRARDRQGDRQGPRRTLQRDELVRGIHFHARRPRLQAS